MTVGSKGIKTEMRGSYIILKGRWSCIVCINTSKRCCMCPVPELRCRLNLWMNVVIVNCWVHESRSARISLQRSSHNTVLYYRPHRVHFTIFVCLSEGLRFIQRHGLKVEAPDRNLPCSWLLACYLFYKKRVGVTTAHCENAQRTHLVFCIVSKSLIWLIVLNFPCGIRWRKCGTSCPTFLVLW